MFSAEGLCCEILARYEDVLTDPQAIANDFVYKMKYDNGQEATLVRTCLRSERMGTPEFNRGPMLGEHTVSILKLRNICLKESSASMTNLFIHRK